VGAVGWFTVKRGTKFWLSWAALRKIVGRLLTLTALTGVSGLAANTGLDWLSRFRTQGLRPQPDPASDYPAALERLARLQAEEGDLINPVCRSRGLLHGQKTERAIVFIHGITSCPQQFALLAEEFHKRGYNVLLARMPRHGYLDRMTDDLKHLRAEELREFADRAVDIAAGLGVQVTIAGLSAGGIVAAWAAQHRSEVNRAVLIAPFLGIGSYARPLQLLLANLLTTLPDVPTQRFRPFEDASPYGYLGFSTRSLGEVQRLGLATAFAALEKPPAAQRLLLVTNAADTSISNTLARQLVYGWQERGIRQVEFYEFERELGLHHDLIGPNNPNQRIDLVYPILLDLIDRP
jgi:pimeloyl-ACP methyl ester carboxylesterase